MCERVVENEKVLQTGFLILEKGKYKEIYNISILLFSWRRKHVNSRCIF